MLDWTELLVPTMPLLELVERGTVIYLALILALRVVGQRAERRGARPWRPDAGGRAGWGSLRNRSHRGADIQ